MQLDEIKPRRSVGDIILGVTEDDVTQALGSDFDRAVDDDGDVQVEYGSLGLRFVFWSDYDFKLGCIGVERSTVSIFSKRLSGLSKSEIERFVAEALHTTVSESDGCTHEDDSVQEWIDVDSHSLSFWFDDDELYLIDVFCEWDDDDDPIWPETNVNVEQRN